MANHSFKSIAQLLKGFTPKKLIIHSDKDEIIQLISEFVANDGIESIKYAVIKDQTVKIALTTPAWASHLRFQKNAILQKIQTKFPQIKTIQIYVQP